MGCSPSPRKHCLELNVVVRVLPQTGWVPFLSLSGPLVGHGMWVERRTGPVHGARKIGSGPRCGPGRLQMRQPEISTWTLTCLTQAGEGSRLIFTFGSFVGPALPKATDIPNTWVPTAIAAQCALAGPGPASQNNFDKNICPNRHCRTLYTRWARPCKPELL